MFGVGAVSVRPVCVAGTVMINDARDTVVPARPCIAIGIGYLDSAIICASYVKIICRAETPMMLHAVGTADIAGAARFDADCSVLPGGAGRTPVIKSESTVGGVTGLIAALEGNWLTPWLMSRVGDMNAVAVFVSLMFWGWLWGIWGLLLAVPITAAVKVVCERVDAFTPVAEILRSDAKNDATERA